MFDWVLNMLLLMLLNDHRSKPRKNVRFQINIKTDLMKEKKA